MNTHTQHLEHALSIDPNELSYQKSVVWKFYKDMWDHGDTSLIPEIFHSDFTFRGSLGPVLVGYEQFAAYVRWVTDTLDDYTSDILEMIEEDNKVSGKLRFHGYHRKPLFECPPSGQHVWWYGAPVFTFDGPKVRDLWVLGDIHGLVQRMRQARSDGLEFSVES